MITVQEAQDIILSQMRDYKTEQLPFEAALGRMLAEDIFSDRDMPAYNRVTMDGIAISYAAYEQGINAFTVKATQAAGDTPIDIDNINECIEIMTGAALAFTMDTIVPYEHLTIDNGIATLLTPPAKKGQNIHYKGKDKTQGDLVTPANTIIDAAAINIAATVGRHTLQVKKQPRILILSTGDELVEVYETPSPFQVRRSNSYAIKAALQQHSLPVAMLHLPDKLEVIKEKISEALSSYDVLILSGGISMGKYDYLPQALEEVGVQKLFHKVRQRPGKPFWFGTYGNGPLVFAFPGNPVSAFMCLHKYFLPWYRKTMGLPDLPPMFALLNEDITFAPQLQYYMQVRTHCNSHAQIVATPVQGNGSGDLANLLESDAFLELPLERDEFKKGDVLRLWPFKRL